MQNYIDKIKRTHNTMKSKRTELKKKIETNTKKLKKLKKKEKKKSEYEKIPT